MGLVIITIIIIVEIVAVSLMINCCRVIDIVKAVFLSNIVPLFLVWLLSTFDITEKLYVENDVSVFFSFSLNVFMALIVILIKTPIEHMIIKENTEKNKHKHIWIVLLTVNALTTVMGALAERICVLIL